MLTPTMFSRGRVGLARPIRQLGVLNGWGWTRAASYLYGVDSSRYQGLQGLFESAVLVLLIIIIQTGRGKKRIP